MPFVIFATSAVQEARPGHPYEEGKDYEEVDAFDYLSRAEYEAPDAVVEDRAFVVPHYLKKKAHFTAELAALTKTFNLEKRRVLSNQAALDWVYLEEVEYLAGELLSQQAGKKKSVNVGCGTVGWRKDTKIVVNKDYEQEAVAWCLEHGHEDAVKVQETIFKKALPVGETIPGVTWPSGQVFFARPAK